MHVEYFVRSFVRFFNNSNRCLRNVIVYVSVVLRKTVGGSD